MSGNVVAELDSIFKPKSLAVIGASSNPAKWGGMVLGRALACPFRGSIYPVNPKETEISGLRAYRDVLEIPDPVDLAVFTIPAAQVPAAMRSCVEKGIKGAVVISADFAETGERGRALEEATIEIAREGGLR
ncbi:unnamed protein product, partial [marine sediment metagenome]